MNLRILGLTLAGFLLSACGPEPAIRYPTGGGNVDCPKGRPRPVLSAKGNPFVLSSHFLRRGHARAIERARLSGQHSLTVHHAGCSRIEHRYVFKLRETPRPSTDRAYWYARASGLIARLVAGSPSPRGFRLMAKRLKAASRSAPPYGETLAFEAYQTLSLSVKRVSEGAQLEVRYRLKL